MADYCAWCALPLLGEDREPKAYEKEMLESPRKIEVALCAKCREQAVKEGWKESNRVGI